jgi:hypothetical protein
MPGDMPGDMVIHALSANYPHLKLVSRRRTVSVPQATAAGLFKDRIESGPSDMLRVSRGSRNEILEYHHVRIEDPIPQRGFHFNPCTDVLSFQYQRISFGFEWLAILQDIAHQYP